MTLRVLSSAFVLTGSLLAGCGGDDGTTPPPECKASGEACTWLGVPDKVGFTKDGSAPRDTTIYWSMDTLFASTGDTYFIDWNNHIVRKFGADKKIHTIVGWDDPVFPGDGDSGAPAAEKSAEGDLGTNVQLNHPTDLYERPDGTILLMAWHNHKLRQYDPATGNVRLLSGGGVGFVDGPMAKALYKQPSRLTMDEAGNIYILDQGNLRIRKIGTDGMVTTIAGIGKHEFSGDGGPALMAGFAWETGDNPEPSGGIAYANNTLYVADTDNNRIRKIDLGSGIVTTIAGTGVGGFSGDGGAATAAQLLGPRDIEIGPDGNLYVADTDNSAVRRIDLGAGTIETIAGTGANGWSDSEEAVPATTMQLHRPFGIDFDLSGTLYIDDSLNSRIVRVNP